MYCMYSTVHIAGYLHKLFTSSSLSHSPLTYCRSSLLYIIIIIIIIIIIVVDDRERYILYMCIYRRSVTATASPFQEPCSPPPPLSLSLPLSPSPSLSLSSSAPPCAHFPQFSPPPTHPPTHQGYCCIYSTLYSTLLYSCLAYPHLALLYFLPTVVSMLLYFFNGRLTDRPTDRPDLHRYIHPCTYLSLPVPTLISGEIWPQSGQKALYSRIRYNATPCTCIYIYIYVVHTYLLCTTYRVTRLLQPPDREIYTQLYFNYIFF